MRQLWRKVLYTLAFGFMNKCTFISLSRYLGVGLGVGTYAKSHSFLDVQFIFTFSSQHLYLCVCGLGAGNISSLLVISIQQLIYLFLSCIRNVGLVYTNLNIFFQNYPNRYDLCGLLLPNSIGGLVSFTSQGNF